MNRHNFTYKKLPPFSFVLFFSIGIITLSAFNQYLLAVAGLMIFIALYLPKKLSLLTRLVSGYALFFVLNILVALLVSALNLRYNLSVVLPVYSVIVALFALHQKRKVLSEKPSLVMSDIVILTLGMIVFYISLSPFISSTSQQLSVLSSGEDNASHYALLNTISSNRSYTYPLSAEESGVLVALKNYPQGLHVNFAMNSQIIAGKHDLAQSFLLKSYVIQICAYLSMLFIVVLLCARRIALSITDEKVFVKTTITLGPILIYGVGFGTNTYMFSYGFHSQITAYIFILLSLLWLMFQELSLWIRSIAASLCGIAVAFIWFFLLPVYVVFIVFWVIVNWSALRSQLLRPRYISLILGTAILVSVPFIIQQNGGDGTSVNTPGGIYPLPLIVIISYGSLAILYLITQRFKQLLSGSPSSLLFFLLVASLIFSFGIGAYQLATIHVFAYYFHKSLYILPLIFSIFSLCFAFIIIKILAKEKLFRVKTSVIAIPTFLISFYVCFLQYPINFNQYESRINTGLVTYVMNNHEDINTPQRLYDIIVTKSCNPIEAYFTQRWLSAVLLTDHTMEKAGIYQAQLKDGSLSELIRSYRKDIGQLDLVYDDTCIPSIMISPESINAIPISKLNA